MANVPKDKEQENNTTNMSFTEKELHSHQIIRHVMQRSKRNVVFHDINRLSAPLISEGRKKEKAFTQQSQIIPKTDTFVEAKNKIKKIYTELGNQTPLWLKIRQSFSPHPVKKQQVKKVRAKSVSISGLISYNFTSIKARNRIAFDPQGTEQQIEKKIESKIEKNRCSKIRSEKIYQATNPSQARLQQELNQAIIHKYPGLTTTQYLKALKKQVQRNKIIYGYKFDHLSKMSQIMSIDRVDQQSAQLSVCQVNHPKKTKRKVKFQKQTKCQNTKVLDYRKVPKSHNKIISTVQLEYNDC